VPITELSNASAGFHATAGTVSMVYPAADMSGEQ
jgi:hypothetical protein